jgi:iron complex outermembrane receptor protein
MTTSTRPHTRALLRHSSRLALTAALTAGFSIGLAATAAQAQTTQAANSDASVVEEVVVTGYRASLRSAMETKKTSDVMLDAINAEDIADFPDSNLAESLQRLPGISIDRDNGEGRTISVRGLSGDFSRVRINNMEALSTGANNDAGASPNRSRAFDFNAFASELFSSVRVRKSSSADADEGSLGATVDLITGKPFDYKKTAFAASAEDSYYENGKTHSPRFTVLASDRWFDGKVGLLLSGAYAKRKSVDDNYGRGAGSSDYTYRGSTWTGDELPGRAGFAAPTGTVFRALIPTTLTGAALDTYKANPANYYNPMANPAAYAEMTGSDPAAYAKLYPNCAAAAAQPVASLTPTTAGCNDSLIRFPALPTLNQKDVDTERLGLTGAFQVQISDRTRLTVDALYSRFKSVTTNYGLSPVGLNRNNTNASYAYGGNVPTATARNGSALTEAQRRGLYPGSCTFAEETELNPGQDCGQSLNGAAPVGGYTFSYNPNNLDPYEYYTNPASPGYAGPGLEPAVPRRPDRPPVGQAAGRRGGGPERRISEAGQCRLALGGRPGRLHHRLPPGVAGPDPRVQRPVQRRVQRRPVGVHQQEHRHPGRVQLHGRPSRSSSTSAAPPACPGSTPASTPRIPRSGESSRASRPCATTSARRSTPTRA